MLWIEPAEDVTSRDACWKRVSSQLAAIVDLSVSLEQTQQKYQLLQARRREMIVEQVIPEEPSQQSQPSMFPFNGKDSSTPPQPQKKGSTSSLATDDTAVFTSTASDGTTGTAKRAPSTSLLTDYESVPPISSTLTNSVKSGSMNSAKFSNSIKLMNSAKSSSPTVASLGDNLSISSSPKSMVEVEHTKNLSISQRILKMHPSTDDAFKRTISGGIVYVSDDEDMLPEEEECEDDDSVGPDERPTFGPPKSDKPAPPPHQPDADPRVGKLPKIPSAISVDAEVVGHKRRLVRTTLHAAMVVATVLD